MIRQVSVVLLIVAMMANAVAHGLMMASPDSATGATHDHLSENVSTGTLMLAVNEELRDKAQNECCPSFGGHVNDKRSSCIADCSYFFTETGTREPKFRSKTFEPRFAALRGRDISNLFRPPKRSS